ncbi:MAG: hypothetical protein DMG06_30470 [Acidobacteria bacterium]|nr:MAG: hypothetical protein DMG06_30470 [Acidobacteriota bacterium]
MGACSQDRLHRSIQRLPVVSSFLGIDVKILLDEEPNQTGMQTADLGNSILPHGDLGKAALTQTKSVDFHWAQVLLEVDGDAGGIPLWKRWRGQQKKQQGSQSRHIATPKEGECHLQERTNDCDLKASLVLFSS